MRIALVLTLFAAIASTAGATTTKAHVAVLQTAPVTVQGTSFHASERVTVTVATQVASRKVVRASRKGAFIVRFPGVTIKYCEAYFIRAKGNRGSLAILKVTPECPAQ
jgi:hypothetical protein